MAQEMNDNQDRNVHEPETPQPGQYRFVWTWLFVLVALITCAWLLNGAKPVLSFDELLWKLRVKDWERFRALAVLGLVLIGVVLIARGGRSR